MKKTVILFVLFSLVFTLPARADINADLMSAAVDGHTATVKTLLDKGANVNAKYKNGWTALMVAVVKGHTETVKALLDKSANVNTKDKDGMTALMWAVVKGHTETVKALLGEGANVNAKDKDGITALMVAVVKGHTETVKALLDEGANVNAKDNNGWTALMMAKDKVYTEIVELLKKSGATELDKGANINAKNNDGCEPTLSDFIITDQRIKQVYRNVLDVSGNIQNNSCMFFDNVDFKIMVYNSEDSLIASHNLSFDNFYHKKKSFIAQITLGNGEYLENLHYKIEYIKGYGVTVDEYTKKEEKGKELWKIKQGIIDNLNGRKKLNCDVKLLNNSNFLIRDIGIIYNLNRNTWENKMEPNIIFNFSNLSNERMYKYINLNIELFSEDGELISHDTVNLEEIPKNSSHTIIETVEFSQQNRVGNYGENIYLEKRISFLKKLNNLKAIISEVDSSYYKEYSLSLILPYKSEAPIYQDDNFKCDFGISENSFNFTIKNFSNLPIEIIWDKVSYIDSNKVTHNIVHQGIKYIDKDKSMKNSTVPPGAIFSDVIIPADNINYISEWQILPLSLNHGEKLALFMPMMIGDKVHNFTFKFLVSTN